MGNQGFDYPATDQCLGLSNDEIAYRTKQYLTLTKMINILTDIAGNKITAIPNPEKYLVDINSILFDLYDTSKERNITREVFAPENRVTGVRQGIVITDGYTVLHEYNDFILKEFGNTKELNDNFAKAKLLISKIGPTSQKILDSISGSCNDIGQITGVLVNNVIQPLEIQPENPQIQIPVNK